MHSEISRTLIYLILILVAARIGAEIATRLRQPAVLGEILAGILLGLIPGIRQAVANAPIVFIAEIGVILLLFEVGLDSEFCDFLSVGGSAALVAVIGVILPLVVGFGTLTLMGYKPHVALFLGGTLAATSIGITARVLRDLRQSQSKEAKIIIGAAVADDILGLILLSVVLGLASGAAISVKAIVGKFVIAVAFLVGATAIGLRAAPTLINLTKSLKTRGVLTASAFIFGLILAYLGSLAGVATVVGAFAAGLVLASTDQKVKITEGIQPFADIFAPVFFTMVGMQVKLSLLNPARRESWPFLLLAGVLLVVAIVTKLLAGLGSFRQRVDKLAVGIGMVPRGEVGLIFATLGLSNKIFGQGIYGAIVIVVLVTTLITPPWLKAQLSHRQRRRRPAPA